MLRKFFFRKFRKKMYLKTRNYFFVLRYPYENISSNKKLLHEMRHFFL